MRELIDTADYRATEIDVVLHLCETIDRTDDDKAHAALVELHAIMRRHLDALAATIGGMAREASLG